MEILLAALLFLSIPAAGWAFWPRRVEGDHPAKCACVLRLIAERGGELDDMDPERNRYAQELAMASRLGLSSPGGMVDTGTHLTPKGRAYLASVSRT